MTDFSIDTARTLLSKGLLTADTNGCFLSEGNPTSQFNFTKTDLDAFLVDDRFSTMGFHPYSSSSGAKVVASTLTFLSPDDAPLPRLIIESQIVARILYNVCKALEHAELVPFMFLNASNNPTSLCDVTCFGLTKGRVRVTAVEALELINIVGDMLKMSKDSSGYRSMITDKISMEMSPYGEVELDISSNNPTQPSPAFYLPKMRSNDTSAIWTWKDDIGSYHVGFGNLYENFESAVTQTCRLK